jgi:hypothetical protein
LVDLGSLDGVSPQELVVGKCAEILANGSGFVKTSFACLEERELVGGSEILVLS